jgi:predicted DNA-binding transcriptional regulator
MVETSEILSSLFDRKTVEVLKVLLVKENVFYLRDVSRETGVSLATTFRIVQRFLPLGLVKREKQGKFTIYKINKDCDIYSKLYDLIIGKPVDPANLLKDELDKYYRGEYKLFPIKGSDNKIFVIGDKIDKAIVDSAVKTVFETSEIEINSMLVNEEQFVNMQNMGLIK